MDKKIALVTGAGSGIGKACAAALLNDGWSVVFTGRRKEVLEAAIASTGALPERAVAVPCDVTDEASVAALFDSIRQRFGRLDLPVSYTHLTLPTIYSV